MPDPTLIVSDSSILLLTLVLPKNILGGIKVKKQSGSKKVTPLNGENIEKYFFLLILIIYAI